MAVTASTAAAMLVAGGAARADTAVGFGSNGSGQLGDGTTIDRTSPVNVTGLYGSVTLVGSGGDQGFALLGGAAYGFGYNSDGELGTGDTTDRHAPVAIPDLYTGVTAITGGRYHTLAIQNGAAYAFGYNPFGELGNGTTTDATRPVAVTNLSSGVTAVAAGVFHSYAIQSGTVYAWGDNSDRQLGNGTTGGRATTPQAVMGLPTGVTTLASGGYHGLAIVSGALYVWGNNAYGQLGIAPGSSPTTARAVPELSTGVTAVAGGDSFSLAVRNGTVYAFGANDRGQLGDGTTVDHATPIQVDPTDLTNIVSVAAATASSYALSGDGSLWVWGDNAVGELGLGTTTALYAAPQHLLAPIGYDYTLVTANSSGRSALALLAPNGTVNNSTYSPPQGTTTTTGSIEGPGSIVLSGGSTVLNATQINQSGLSVTSGATLNLTADAPSVVNNATITDGTIGGSAPNGTTAQTSPTVLTVSGTATLGNVTLKNGVDLNVTGSATTTGNNISGDPNAAVTVATGGSLTDSSTGTVYVSVPLNDAGTVAVTAAGGSLIAYTGGTHSGTFTVAAGASLAVNGNFTATAVVNNSGTFDLCPYLAGGSTFAGTLNVLAGGTLLLDGNVNVTAAATVNVVDGTPLGNAVTAQGVTFDNKQVMNFGPAVLSGGITFRNAGLSLQSVTFTSGALAIETGGTVSVGTLNVNGPGVLTSGLSDGHATTLSVGTFNVSGGAVSANVNVTTAMNFTGGNLDGGDGTQCNVVVEPGATLTESGTGVLTRGAKLTVSADTTTSAPSGLTVGSDAATALTSRLTILKGASVTVGHTLAVGNAGSVTTGTGSGVIDVQSGAALVADTVLLGNTHGGDGALNVSGKVTVRGLQMNDVTVNAGGTLAVPDEDAPDGQDPELNRSAVGGYQRDGALNNLGGMATLPYLKLGLTAGFTGTYNQTGGTTTVTSALGVGNDPNGTLGAGVGVVSITGGGTTAAQMLVGSSAGGVGTVTVNGGRLNVTGAATVRQAGSQVALTSGTLAAGSLDLGGVASRLNWTGGTLLIEGTGSDLGGPQTIPKGGTLGGTGTTANGTDAITVAGTVAPGADVGQVGTLTTGSQVWAAGGTLAADVASVDGTTVSSADRLVLSGLDVSATPDGKFLVTVTGLSSNPAAPTVPDAGAIVLVDDTDKTAANPFAPNRRSTTLAALSLSSATGVSAPDREALALDTASDGAGGYELVVVAAPEPASLLLATLGAAPLLLGRRPARR